MNHSISPLLVAILIPMLVFFASILYGVVESIAAFRLRPWPYRRGLVVLSESRPSAAPPPFREEVQLTASGRYRMLAPDAAIFCFGRQLFSFRFNTTVPVRGTIRWTEGRAVVTGRLPSEMPWVWASWVGFAAAFGIMAALSPKNGPSIWWFLPLSVAFMLLTGPALIPFEKRRASRVAAEILAWKDEVVAPEGLSRHWKRRALWAVGFFVALWLIVTAAVSITSGWHLLGRRFPADDAHQRYSETDATIQMRKGNGVPSGYSHMVRLGADEHGIALGLPLGFRLLSPPLFIPWEAIRTCRRTRNWGTYLEIEVEVSDPDVTIDLADKTGSIAELCADHVPTR
jgi:hypothetical protein